ncbi:MAG TPA: hypothetical protein VMA83_00705 [Solirubrobacteraceae bacterium]|nr:hypothetical protein [Solirubrobacteraceae bacterium]
MLALWVDSISIGEALVAGGTIALAVGTAALAWFTYGLGAETVAIDARNAARARKRREREVRGVARVVTGELGVVEITVVEALKAGSWDRSYPTPHGAWDRDGAVIAEAVAEDDAQRIITFIAQLTAWESYVAGAARRDTSTFVFNEMEKEAVGQLIAFLKDARAALKPVAYPDARELEPDPDALLARPRGRWRPRRQ